LSARNVLAPEHTPMTDLHDMRARMRETGHQAEPTTRSGVPFWIVTVCAVAVGFAVVLLAPRFYTPQRTAALPTVKTVVERPDPLPRATAVPDLPAGPARYAGKSPEEMAKTADAVCPQLPSGPTSIAFQSERLHCLLTEAPGRYCVATQRSKITAAIIDHFRIVEHAAKAAKIEVEPRILVAIEGLMRAGYLLKPQREDIASSVSREIKERFARVVGNKAPCPEQPWWQVWK
jgi:hypothetical protein